MNHRPTIPRCAIRARVLLAVAVVATTGAAACGRDRKNLPFGAGCDSDRDCKSDICLFANRSSKQGRCTQPCELEGNDCPPGTTCTTIAEHAGRSVPVCGEPPPVPFGPQGNGTPPPIAPGSRPTQPFPRPGERGEPPPGTGSEPPPPVRPPPAGAPPATPAPAAGTS